MICTLRVLLTGAAVLLSVASYAQKGARKNAIEDKISVRIFHLPEVTSAARRVDSLSKGRRHLATLIYERPSANSKYYKVKVVEDNGVSLVAYFHYFVSEDTLVVKSMPME